VSLRNTLAYLTSLRIPPRTRIPLPHSLHYFPWVAAAHGSLNILFFLALARVLPTAVASLFAVLFPAALAGFTPWRGVLEAARGIRTAPGHKFTHGFRLQARDVGIVTALVVLKWITLMLLTDDWRVRAVFVFPILGLCAHTTAFLLEPEKRRPRGSLITRRRVRTGFLTGLLLFLVFLFPLRAAVAVLVLGGGVAWWTWRRGTECGRGAESGTHGLTLQTAALVSELTEAAVLAALVFAELVLFRL
jgi:cobalamin synthase